jgi:hypothetical protein
LSPFSERFCILGGPGGIRQKNLHKIDTTENLFLSGMMLSI